MTGPDGFTLRLEDVPPQLMLDLLGTLDGFQREVQLVALHEGEASPVDASTEQGLVVDRSALQSPRAVTYDQAVAARDAGAATVVIVAHYRAEEIEPSLSATAAIGQADEAARAGELLAPPMPPEQRRLWEWVGHEFRTQMAGGPVTAFPAEA